MLTSVQIQFLPLNKSTLKQYTHIIMAYPPSVTTCLVIDVSFMIPYSETPPRDDKNKCSQRLRANMTSLADLLKRTVGVKHIDDVLLLGLRRRRPFGGIFGGGSHALTTYSHKDIVL